MPVRAMPLDELDPFPVVCAHLEARGEREELDSVELATE